MAQNSLFLTKYEPSFNIFAEHFNDKTRDYKKWSWTYFSLEFVPRFLQNRTSFLNICAKIQLGQKNYLDHVGGGRVLTNYYKSPRYQNTINYIKGYSDFSDPQETVTLNGCKS